MPQTILDLFNKGIQANRVDKFRKGNLICLPAKGDLIASGDLHGHRRNFERLVTFANLPKNPDRHVMLQELIHGGPVDSHGDCLSYRLLFDAVRYKLDFPDQVHFVMGNHDTTFITDGKVIKDGKEMNHSMSLAMAREFGPDCDEIKPAMKNFLLSQPLAVKCDNRIWLSHSLPADRCIDKFDNQVFDRPLKISDLVKPASGYLLTWGRKHGQQSLDELAKLFDVDIFILGHQPQQQGWIKAGHNLIIIASEHNHGCLLPIDLTKSYTVEQLVEFIVPLASIS
jgi:Icc-related predicted phosphoesterase